jgi:hypothetical protein
MIPRFFEIVCRLLNACVSLLLKSKYMSERVGRPTQEGRPPQVLRDFTAKYRTLDGATDYMFRFREFEDRTFRIYILESPSYGARNSHPQFTHRNEDERGLLFICWTRPITDLSDARKIAAKWAEATEQYRHNGVLF